VDFRRSGFGHNTFTRLRVMYDVSSLDAKSVPHTKYSKGPKLRAAAAPMKCSPGTELLNP